MNILILTQYYLPETGAPQNRLSELAARFMKEGHRVEVLTAMPNYPFMKVFEGYRKRWYVKEQLDGVTVHRAWVFVRKSSRLRDRLFTYFSFVCTSFWTGWIRLKRVDLIICESPPLFLGISAWLLRKIKGARLLFNVSDLWPESAAQLGLIRNRTALRMSTWLEEFLYRHSDLVSGQTQGIVRNISSRFPAKPCFWLKNGVDLGFFSPRDVASGWREKNGFSREDFITFYGGILGYAQGLEVILKAAQILRDDDRVKFVLAGDGPLKDELVALAGQMELSNVTFLNPYPKAKMPDVISGIDLPVIPLRRLGIFKGAIPSKIFECLAMGKPILLGVEGEARELFIEQGQCGLAFTPEDPEDLVRCLTTLRSDQGLYHRLSRNAYIYVSEYFDREKIFSDFQQFINQYLDFPGPRS